MRNSAPLFGLTAALAGVAILALSFGPPVGPGSGPLRDEPLPTLPNRVERLLIVGTSLSHRERWPEALADRLERCTGTRPQVEVIAQPGAASDWGAAQLIGRIGPPPSAALVEFGANDADRLDGLSESESYAAHTRIFAALEGVPTVVMRMSPALGLRGWTRLGREEREDAIAAWAVSAGIGILDLDRRWRARWEATKGWRAEMPDGLHPLPAAAAAVIAPAAAALLVPNCPEDVP